MAMKVCYNVVNGQVLSETRGGVRRSYVTDGLGSTLALLDSTGAKTDTFDYFPSGTVASRTGTTPTPFQWNGGSGYYRDNSKRTHVRARNFNVNLGRWQEPDPIGFEGGDFNLYRYVKNRFVVLIDPSGLYLPCGSPNAGICCVNPNGMTTCSPPGRSDCCTKWQKLWQPGGNEQLPGCSGGDWVPFDKSEPQRCANLAKKKSKDQSFCSAIAQRIKNVAPGCNDTPNYGPGNRGGQTFCCCNDGNAKVCAIRMCNNAGLPTDNDSGLCIRGCLYLHESVHALQCFVSSERCNANSSDNPGNFPWGGDTENCAWSAEVSCLYNQAKKACQGSDAWAGIDSLVQPCLNKWKDCSNDLAGKLSDILWPLI